MPSQPDDLIGRVVAGRYRVLERLGQGGMGTVYLAIHEAIEKKLALKVLRAEYSAKPDLVTRFQQEAISASRIKHPNVLDVFDFGQLDNGCFFLAMEFLEGRDLADELEQCHVLSAERALKIVLQICKALAAAHARGVVHRDLKPENVFLQLTAEGDEQVKIVDFGIAQLRSTEDAAKAEPQRRRLTRTGMIFGTPEYMSPEQAAGKHVDLRVDVYATGIILYEMLTGAVPFTGDTFFSVLQAHLNHSIPPVRGVNPDVKVSAELEAVIAKALAKDPAQRYQSMREIATALLATPEGTAYDPYSRQSALPTVTLAEFDKAAAESARQFAEERGGKPDAAPRPAVGAEAPQTAAGARTLHLGTQPTVPAVGTPRRAPVGAWIALIALAAAASAVVWLKLGTRARGDGGQPGPETPPHHSGTTVTPSGATVVPMDSAPKVEPSAPPTTPRSVRLTVVSEPEGAIVLKDGFQVCDKTPCDVTVAPNETLELEGRKDKLRGKAKVLAQKDQVVTIRLTPTVGPAASTKMVPCWKEVVDENGLKGVKRGLCPQ